MHTRQPMGGAMCNASVECGRLPGRLQGSIGSWALSKEMMLLAVSLSLPGHCPLRHAKQYLPMAVVAPDISRRYCSATMQFVDNPACRREWVGRESFRSLLDDLEDPCPSMPGCIRRSRSTHIRHIVTSPLRDRPSRLAFLFRPRWHARSVTARIPDQKWTSHVGEAEKENLLDRPWLTTFACLRDGQPAQHQLRSHEPITNRGRHRPTPGRPGSTLLRVIAGKDAAER
ncbi:hypothetical protein QBC47DRAFT_163908 [Echria macrotheca]|uniref:Uncharacterized protein n=1 Tax=Echria macrotheca TaxID=438768 RepID=A0AAJ0BIX6_9PEZI|nr:hypothetical protein QBC47DRAFT_163908 [Echria macrotheca]